MTAAAAQDSAKPSAGASQAKPAKAKPTRKRTTARRHEVKRSAAKSHSGRAAHPATGSAEPTLLGQYGDWSAYTAAPGGKKVCFALSKPKSTKASKDDVKRDQAYIFISTRPADKVKNEVSIILGYPLSTKIDTTASVGSSSFDMLTQKDGAWIKNAAEEPQLIEAIRKGSDLVVKGTSTHGTHTTDTYSLKGVSSALDRVAKECGDSA
jgi:hypothetical protein